MSKRKYRRYAAFLLSVFLLQTLIGSLSFLGTNKVQAEGINKFEISTYDGGSEYWTGSKVIYNVDIVLSASDPTINSPKVEIRFPADYINSVRASDVASQISKAVVNSGEEYIITYEFNQILGGSSMRIPIEIQTHNGNTPDGYQLDISGKIFDGNNVQVANSNTLATSFKTNKPKMTKRLNPNITSPVYAGKEDPDKPGYISSDIDDTVPVAFSYDVGGMRPFSPVGTGNRTYSSTLIEDHVPEGAVFLASDNPGWSYDPVTRIASYDYNYDYNWYIYSDSGNTFSKQLKLRFPGFATTDVNNLTIRNEAKAIFTPLNQTDYESKIESDSYVDFRLTSEIAVKNYYNGKSPLNNIYILDRLSEKTKEYGYSIYISNTQEALNLENFKLTDHSLDSRLKFFKITISQTNLKNIYGSVTVEAEDASGIITTLATGIDASTGNFEINIPDGTIKIHVKGDPGSYIKYPLTFSANVYFKFKDPENTTTNIAGYMYNSLTTEGNYTGIDKKLQSIQEAPIYSLHMILV